VIHETHSIAISIFQAIHPIYVKLLQIVLVVSKHVEDMQDLKMLLTIVHFSVLLYFKQLNPKLLSWTAIYSIRSVEHAIQASRNFFFQRGVGLNDCSTAEFVN